MKKILEEKTGLHAPEILFPNKGVDLSKWATVACDQFTSEIEYWNELESIVGDSPSALRVTLPEIYLNEDCTKRIEKINATMKEYLSQGVLKSLGNGFILTIRSTPYTKRRIGLIASLDLEKYDYKKGEKPLIRATEGTVEERIPPRLKIRKNADIELTHIMVLYNDETRSINEKLYANKDSFEKIYDFTLNMNGGKIEGYFIKDTESIIKAFAEQLNEETLVKKYGEKTPFLFAVGDGNHSLATAKAHWNAVKENLSEEERAIHPARFALCEIVNVYDEGIEFLPIHRFVKGVDAEKLKEELLKVEGNFTVYANKCEYSVKADCSVPATINAVDKVIKEYIEEFGGEVDYVHGDENVKALADKGGLAVMLPSMEKGELFPYVVNKGTLPRKTFSMGEGVEKRYYLEVKSIK